MFNLVTYVSFSKLKREECEKTGKSERMNWMEFSRWGRIDGEYQGVPT